MVNYSRLALLHENVNLIPIGQRGIPLTLLNEFLIEMPVYKDLMNTVLMAMQSSPRLIWLVGAAGSGKTSLILRLRKELEAQARDIRPIPYDMRGELTTLPFDDPQRLMAFLLSWIYHGASRALLTTVEEREKFATLLAGEAGTRGESSGDRDQFAAWVEQRQLTALRLLLKHVREARGLKPLFIFDSLDACPQVYERRLTETLLDIVRTVECSTLAVARPTTSERYSPSPLSHSGWQQTVVRVGTEDLQAALERVVEDRPGTPAGNLQLARNVISAEIGRYPLISTLARGDTRRAVGLMERVLESPHLRTANGSADVGDSEVLQALMLGARSIVASDDLPMVNMYRCTEAEAPELIVLGLFLLSAYREPRVLDGKMDELVQIGIPELAIQEATESFIRFGLLEPATFGRLARLTDVGGLHMELVSHPVYVLLAAQDATLPAAILQGMSPGEVLLRGSQSGRALGQFFDHLVDAHHMLLQRVTAEPRPNWLASIGEALRESKRRAMRSWERLSQEGAIGELRIRITDTHVSPELVAAVLHSMTSLAGGERRCLELSYASSGSFIGKITGPVSVVNEVASFLKSLGRAAQRLQLINETRGVLRARREALLAEADLSRARAAKARVAAFIELLGALRETNECQIEFASQVLLSKLASGSIAAPHEDEAE
jgi:hypothetical protein